MSTKPVKTNPLSLIYTAPTSRTRPVLLRFADGSSQRQDVTRWFADADPADFTVVNRCTGPTLDLGCGPGRMATALARRGVPALGVDLSAAAVAIARARGAAVICRDLFARLPGEGRWSQALLVDGNIGIGGDPVRLLRRVADLLAPHGQLLVEVSVQDVDRRGTARLSLPGEPHALPFPWAELGAPALARTAAEAGWHIGDRWTTNGRAFATLDRRLGRPQPVTRSPLGR